MTNRAITATKTLRQRKDGDVAFFDGEVEGLKIRIQTQVGHPLRVRIDGAQMVPQTDEADAMLAEMLADALARDAAKAALIERKRAEAPARVEAIMAEVTKNSTAEHIEANAALVRAWRATAAEYVAATMGYAAEWGSLESDVRTIGERMYYHRDHEVRRLMRER